MNQNVFSLCFLMLLHVSANILAANRSIEKEVVVDAPVADVWKAWTTNEGAQTFFSPHTNIDARPRGAV